MTLPNPPELSKLIPDNKYRRETFENLVRDLAFTWHADVNHDYDGKPYAYHLNMVIAWVMHFIHLLPAQKQTEVICGAWTHDANEDTRQSFNQIVEAIYQCSIKADVHKSIPDSQHHATACTVANLVYACTNDKGKTRGQRAGRHYYAGIRKTYGATFIKLCDRLANVQYSKRDGGKSGMFKKYCAENKKFMRRCRGNIFNRMYNHFFEWVMCLPKINYKPMFDELEKMCEA